MKAFRREQDLLWNAHRREHELQDKSIDLAAKQINHRLEEMNNLREQVSSERGRFLMREYYDTQHEELKRRMSAMESLISNFQGRFWVMATIPSVVVIIIDVVIRFMSTHP